VSVPVGLYQTAANANDIPRYLEVGKYDELKLEH